MHYIIERNTYFTILEDEIQNVLVLKVDVEFINAAPHARSQVWNGVQNGFPARISYPQLDTGSLFQLAR